MLNQTGFKTESYGTRKTILVDEFNSTALSCMVSNEGVTADSDGKKIVKAGTPVYGSILERNTPLTVSAKTTGSGQDAVTTKLCGVILHDVDVTAGTANSQVLIFGFIDVTKVDSTTATKLKSAVSDLKMIQLVARS